jgi:hypothetical protein
MAVINPGEAPYRKSGLEPWLTSVDDLALRGQQQKFSRTCFYVHPENLTNAKIP